MSEEEIWLAEVAGPWSDEAASSDWRAWFSETFAAHGAISEERLQQLAGAEQRKRAQDACDRVREDVRRTTGQSVDVTTESEDGWLRFACQGDFSNHDSGGVLAIDAEVIAAEAAGAVQDVLMDVWMRPWPECRQHSRVYDPALRRGRAAWVCPGGHVEVVGELRS